VKKPRVLYLSPKSPAAYNDGGRMRCSFIADALHGGSELSVWVMEDKVSADDPTRRSVPWEQVEFGRLVPTKLQKIARYVHGALLLWPVQACGYMDASRSVLLVAKLKTFRPDIVILGDSQLGILEPFVRKQLPHARIILDTHNVDWLLVDRVGRQTRQFLQKLKLFVLSRNIKFSETRAVSSCDEVWATSEDDADMFKKMGAKHVYVIPNAIDLEAYNALPLAGNRSIAYCGWYAYPPNEQAALFLIRISHNLHSQGCIHTLRLIGRDPTQKMFSEANRASHIEIVGEVDSAAAEILKSDIFAAPILAGSGTKFKIIEALALGRAVITTSIGNEGLRLQSDCQVIISEPDDFCGKVKSLLEFSDVSQALANNGRKWVEDNLLPGNIRTKIVERLNADNGMIS
jgi:polysaccharide biosynthesis protein PslH